MEKLKNIIALVLIMTMLFTSALFINTTDTVIADEEINIGIDTDPEETESEVDVLPYELAYSLNSDGKSLTLTGFAVGKTPDESYELTIPAEADYYYDASDKKVKLSKSLPITAIAGNAFRYTNYKQEVAFDTSNNVNYVTKVNFVGNNLTTIGSGSQYVFYNLVNLRELKIPDSVTKIGRLCGNSSSLVNVHLGKGIKTLPERTFSNSPGLKTFSTYAETFTTISSIWSARNLTMIYLYADNIKLSGKLDLVGTPNGTATDLKFCVANNTVKNRLVELGYVENNIYVGLPYNYVYTSDDGYSLDCTLYTHNNEATINGFINKPDVLTDIYIPEIVMDGDKSYKVTEIANSAFDGDIKSGSLNIRGMYLPETVKTVGSYAFRRCSNMNYADLPGVTSIGAAAFKSCYVLYNVNFAEGLKSIPNELFYDCRALTNLIVPSTVTDMNANAITQCRKLTSLAILSKNITITGKFSGIGYEAMVTPKYYVRTESAKTYMQSNGVSSNNITVATDKVVLLKNGYNYGVAGMLGGTNSVTLPTAVSRQTQRYMLVCWKDGETSYAPGDQYNFDTDDDFVILEANWILDPTYNKPLSINEIKEAKPNLSLIEEIIHINEVDNEDLTVSGTLNVKVNESNVLNYIDDDWLFGVQYEIANNKLLNDDGSDMSDVFLNSIREGEFGSIPVARYGGDSTSWKNLAYNSKPYILRRNSINLNTGTIVNQKLDYGPVEFIKNVLAINPEASFIFALSMVTMTPEDSVEFWRFLRDESDYYKNLRTSVGLTAEPIKLAGFELGNETYHDIGETPWTISSNGTRKVNESLVVYYGEEPPFDPNSNEPLTTEQVASGYADTALEHIKALHAVDPDLELMPVLVDNDNLTGGMVWNRIIAQKLGNHINTGVIHFYYGINAGSHKSENDTLDAIKQIFREEVGYTKDLQFAITEHALYSGGQEESYNSLRACVSDAQFFTSILNRQDVWVANYHNFFGITNWSYYQDIDGEYVQSGVADFYELYKSMLGDRAVGIEYRIGNFPSVSPVTPSNILAMVNGDDELILVLTNTKQNSSATYTNYTVNFDFENKYTLESETIFTAPNYFSYKASDNSKDIFKTITKTYTDQAPSRSFSYSLDPCRVVFLKFKSTSPIADSGIPVFEEPSDVIYRDLMDAATIDNDTYYFAEPNQIDRIIYSGSNADFVVRAQQIDGDWVKLVNYSDFTDGNFLNSYSDELFKAVRFENASVTDEVQVLSAVNGFADITVDNGILRLYPRIDGVDCFGSYTATTSDDTLLEYKDGKFIAKKTGKSDITIGDITFTANITTNVGLYKHSEDFENWSEEKEADWIGSDYTDYTDYTIGKYSGDYSSAAIMNLGIHTDQFHSSLYYNKDRTNLSERQRISADLVWLDRDHEIGIRFMIHNEGNNYYELIFRRRLGAAYFNEAWNLYKVTDGTYRRLKTGYSYGSHSWSTGTVHVDLVLDRGNISWTAYNTELYPEFSGDYYDREPYSFAGNDATFGFFGYVRTYDRSDPFIYNLLIDNVEVTSLANHNTEEVEIGVPSDEIGNYKLSYSLNKDATLEVTGFEVYPNQPYDLVIPETANYYTDKNGRKITLTKPLPVTTIADNAFSRGCESDGTEIITYSNERPNTLLSSITFEGSNIKSIGNNAFAYCTVDEISTYADELNSDSFVGCNIGTLNLSSTEFDITDDSMFDSTISQINVRNEDAKSILTGLGYSEDTVKIEFAFDVPSDDNSYVLRYVYKDGIGNITGFAELPESAVDVVIPNTVEDDGCSYAVYGISDKAFYDVEKINSVYISDGISRVGEEAFYGNNSLLKCRIPGTAKLEKAAFKTNIFLKDVELCEGIKEIPHELFYNAQRLENLVIPSTVTSISCTFIGGATNSLAKVAFLCDTPPTRINTSTFGSSGKLVKDEDGNTGAGTVYYVKNEKVKKFIEDCINEAPTYPQKAEIITEYATPSSVSFENGILTVESTQGLVAGINVLEAEYEDQECTILKSIKRHFLVNLFPSVRTYDFTDDYGSGGYYKIFVYKNLKSLEPVCESINFN